MKYARPDALELIVERIEGSPLPIDLDLVKQHCAVDGTDLDELVTLYLRAAIDWAETFTHRNIFRRSAIWILDNFPQREPYRLQLPRGITRAVTAVRYYDAAGSLQLLSGPTGSPTGSDYLEDLQSDTGGVLVPPINGAWPDALTTAAAPVQIEFDAGWDAADVPESIVQAILFATSDMLEARGQADLANAGGSSFQVRQTLLSPYIIRRW